MILIKWIRNIYVVPNFNLEARLNLIGLGLGLVLQILSRSLILSQESRGKKCSNNSSHFAADVVFKIGDMEIPAHKVTMYC